MAASAIYNIGLREVEFKTSVFSVVLCMLHLIGVMATKWGTFVV